MHKRKKKKSKLLSQPKQTQLSRAPTAAPQQAAPTELSQEPKAKPQQAAPTALSQKPTAAPQQAASTELSREPEAELPTSQPASCKMSVSYIKKGKPPLKSIPE